MLLYGVDRRQQRRSPAGVVISLALHAMAAAGALYVAGISPSGLPRPLTRALTFVSVSDLPAIPPVLPMEQAPLPPPTITETPRVEPPTERPAVLPPPTLEARRVEVQPPSEQPVPRELPPRPEVPKPPPVQVAVGAFPTRATHIQSPDPSRQVQATGFAVPASAKSPALNPDKSVVGIFGNAAPSDARPGSDRPAAAVVANTGFGAVSSAPVHAPPARPLGDAGFGNVSSSAPSSQPTAVAKVQQTGFEGAPSASPTQRPVPRLERVNVSVEVVSKPTPAYTDEARALKIEGDVLLEVDFCASGQVRVLRVVKGLGHGLDEAATRAAEHIQFKPARSSSGPVDFRTIVHITFRLT